MGKVSPFSRPFASVPVNNPPREEIGILTSLPLLRNVVGDLEEDAVQLAVLGAERLPGGTEVRLGRGRRVAGQLEDLVLLRELYDGADHE